MEHGLAMFFFFAQKILKLKRYFSASSLWVLSKTRRPGQMVSSFFSALLNSGSIKMSTQTLNVSLLKVSRSKLMFVCFFSLNLSEWERYLECSALSSVLLEVSFIKRRTAPMMFFLVSLLSKIDIWCPMAVPSLPLLSGFINKQLSHYRMVFFFPRQKTGPIKYLKHTQKRGHVLSPLL